MSKIIENRNQGVLGGIDRIKKTFISQEMEESYLDYSMTVIVQRALPDVRDGLKPVQRRILYAMHNLGLNFNARFRKSATIVGEVLGKYHPHGDIPVYDALVHLAQDFKLRYPLIASQGNFGSMDGDEPAAMRYTETKLSKIASSVLVDIEKDTVDFMPNFDSTQKEPKVLPSTLPNLLVNGTMGIAVGMATNIPPHNISEICDAVVSLIDNPDATCEDLLEYVKGPDFPTGGIIYNFKDIKQVYATGRGGITTRAKAEIIENRKGMFQIIVHEIPFQVNKASLIEKVAQLHKEKRISGIKDIRDESNKEGVRIVIDLRKNAFPKKVLNKLFSLTELQTKFHVNMTALVSGIEPRVLNLKVVLEEYLKHRNEVIIRRTKFELERAKARLHILEGLRIALENLDAVIKTIRGSASREKAKINLIKKFKLSPIQAEAILQMRLEQLSRLERDKIENEYKEKIKLIKKLEAILASPKKILEIIKKELVELKETYGDERRTKIVKGGIEKFSLEDVEPDNPCIILLSKKGYIKRLPMSSYKPQGRGGKGVSGCKTCDEDIIDKILLSSVHSTLFFFTDKGLVFSLKAYEIPESSKQSRGQALVNFIQVDSAEKVTALVSITRKEEKENEEKFLFMATRKGIIKKVGLSCFDNIRRSGMKAIGLDKDDFLGWVSPVSRNDEIVLVTSNGQAIRFKEKDARKTGRPARGIRGIRLRKEDRVVSMDVVEKGDEAGREVLVVTQKGYGKRTVLAKYSCQKRGGSGLKTSQTTLKIGNVVSAKVTGKEDTQVLFASRHAQVICLKLNNIPSLSRVTQGVRLMRLSENDEVSSMTVL